jgi:hypothetical protein
MRTRGQYECRLVQKGFVPVSLIGSEENGVGYRSLKRVLCKHEASIRSLSARGLRHEQNYTYDNVTLKEGIAQLEKHVEDQAGNMREGKQKRRLAPVSLMLMRSRFLGCGRTCLSDVAARLLEPFGSGDPLVHGFQMKAGCITP